MIIDADGLVLGRMASHVAKRLLKGESVTILNAEKALISGSRKRVTTRFQRRYTLRAKGNPRKGPKLSKTPDRIVRRAIRNMLPVHRKRGREALHRLMVCIGVPESLKNQEAQSIEDARSSASSKSVRVESLSQWLGARWN